MNDEPRTESGRTFLRVLQRETWATEQRAETARKRIVSIEHEVAAAYEAAVEALERLLNDDLPDKDYPLALFAARAALARLRDKVPA